MGTQQESGEYTKEYGHYCTVVFNKDGLSIRENVRDTRRETTVLRTLSRIDLSSFRKLLKTTKQKKCRVDLSSF